MRRTKRKTKAKKVDRTTPEYKAALAKVMSMSFEQAQAELALKIGGTVAPHGGVIPPKGYRP